MAMHNGWIQDLKGRGEHGVFWEGGLFMIKFCWKFSLICNCAFCAYHESNMHNIHD